jgi:hypothetical protein
LTAQRQDDAFGRDPAGVAPIVARMPSGDGHERSRKILVMLVVLWLAAIAALAVGMRTRIKPVLLVGLVGGLAALVLTQAWLRGGGSRRE